MPMIITAYNHTSDIKCAFLLDQKEKSSLSLSFIITKLMQSSEKGPSLGTFRYPLQIYCYSWQFLILN